VQTMIGGKSTEGTSEKGMTVRNLVNRGDRRGNPLSVVSFPSVLNTGTQRMQYSIKLSHLPDPHTGTYCIYIFFYDDGRIIRVLLVTTSPARQIVSIICINASTKNAETMIGGGKKIDCGDFTTLQMLVYNRSQKETTEKETKVKKK
jgi:hypothetical protein